MLLVEESLMNANDKKNFKKGPYFLLGDWFPSAVHPFYYGTMTSLYGTLLAIGIYDFIQSAPQRCLPSAQNN